MSAHLYEYFATFEKINVKTTFPTLPRQYLSVLHAHGHDHDTHCHSCHCHFLNNEYIQPIGYTFANISSLNLYQYEDTPHYLKNMEHLLHNQPAILKHSPELLPQKHPQLFQRHRTDLYNDVTYLLVRQGLYIKSKMEFPHSRWQK